MSDQEQTQEFTKADVPSIFGDQYNSAQTEVDMEDQPNKETLDEESEAMEVNISQTSNDLEIVMVTDSSNETDDSTQETFESAIEQSINHFEQWMGINSSNGNDGSTHEDVEINAPQTSNNTATLMEIDSGNGTEFNIQETMETSTLKTTSAREDINPSAKQCFSDSQYARSTASPPRIDTALSNFNARLNRGTPNLPDIRPPIAPGTSSMKPPADIRSHFPTLHKSGHADRGDTDEENEIYNLYKPDEDDDPEARDEFMSDVEQFRKLQEQGSTLSIVSDIEYRRLKSKELLRLRKISANKMHETGDDEANDPLFVPTDGDCPFDDSPCQSDNDEDSEGDDRDQDYGEGPSMHRTPEIPIDRARDPMSASVEAAIDRELRLDKRSQRKKDKLTNKSVKDKQTSVQDKTAKVSKPRKPKDQRKSKKAPVTGPNMFNMASLVGSSVFRNSTGEKDPDRELLGLNSSVRDVALRKLVSSLPQEFRSQGRVDMAHLLEAARKFSRPRSVYADPESRKWGIKGLDSKLDHFQMLGVSRMRTLENAVQRPKGGILADEMGLGKTVMMLANIIDGAPATKRQDPHATLVICPSSIAGQWVDEINKHCTTVALQKLSGVEKYYGRWKMQEDVAAKNLKRKGIVITTYAEVLRSCRKVKFPEELVTLVEKEEWLMKNKENVMGVLHQIYWHRIVVDEAHLIKNHLAQTSVAVRELTADYRWAMSGTPIHNSPKELYPYFKFLRVPSTGNYQTFLQNYDTKTEIGARRLQLLLSGFMIRRVHSDQIFGKPILELEKATHNTLFVHFNPLERTIYNLVRERIIEKINSLIQQKKLRQNYGNILILFLRLRQMTSHILMVEFAMKDLLTDSDIEQLQTLADAVNVLELESQRAMQIIQLRLSLAQHRFRKHKALQEQKQIDCQLQEAQRPDNTLHDGTSGEEMDSSQQPVINPESESSTSNEKPFKEDEFKDTGKSHGLSYDFQPYLNDLLRTDRRVLDDEDIKCPICACTPQEPMMTSCGHIYCLICITFLQETSAMGGMPSSSCTSCGKVYASSAPYVATDQPANAAKVDSTPASGSISKDNKGKKGKNRKSKEKPIWLKINGPEILPSSKTIAVKTQILNWFKEDSKAKIIIFTQFLPMIQILEKVCKCEGWTCSSYHGKMDFEAREKTIARFRDHEGQAVLLVSLKAGGVGLNLTMAQKVILLDPWWNNAIEQQAFCRVHRIGQTKETALCRIVVKDTVDEKIIKLQDEKQAEINKVMDLTGQKGKQLSTMDLLKLFGDVSEDEDGVPFIIIDDEDRVNRTQYFDDGDPMEG